MTTIHTDRKDQTIDRICRMVGYTGRDVRIETRSEVYLSGTYWDGGRKSDYYGFNIATMQAVALPSFNPPQFGGPSETPRVTLLDNMVIVEVESYGSGRTGCRINVRPENATPFLPKVVELTEDEGKVLFCTKSYKSSYGGIKDFRQHQSGLTPERWEAAKASCIAKGLLNKAGAITNEGRNVAPRR